MHPLLLRQLKRLGLDPEAPPNAGSFRVLLEHVTRSYAEADHERYLIERSLEISSKEMRELYEDLRKSSEAELSKKSAELARSLALAQTIQEAVLDGILVVDDARRVVSVNQHFVEMFSFPEEVMATRDDEKLIGHVLSQLVDPDEFIARVSALYDAPTAVARDEVRLRDGRVFDRYSAPLRASSTSYGRIWCFRDVTQERRLEFERLVVSERMASMGRLVASVAHEINNPLAFVIANVDFLSMQLRLDDKQSECATVLAEVREGLDRIRVIVRDLRALSRADEESRALVDLAPILDSSIQIATNHIRHRAPLRRRYQPVPKVRANAARIGQVFLNLLVNAAQAIPEGFYEQNEITVVLAAEHREHGEHEERVCVEIHDTGGGIAEEHRARVFDPFFTTKEVGAGVGLGLSMCKGIVEAHGGSLDFTSEVGRGSVFRVLLPAGEGAVESRRSSTRIAVGTATAKRARVLVIDDEAVIRTAFQRLLGGDHEVVTCENAARALARLDEAERWDVIFCDLMMPERSGMEFYEAVVEKSPHTAERIVFLTGGAFTPRAKSFVERVGRTNVILEKPFSWDEVRRLVVEACR